MHLEYNFYDSLANSVHQASLHAALGTAAKRLLVQVRLAAKLGCPLLGILVFDVRSDTFNIDEKQRSPREQNQATSFIVRACARTWMRSTRNV